MTEQDTSSPGPQPETVKIDGPWEAAIDKALAKKRPIGGFPKPPVERKRPKYVPKPPKPPRARKGTAPKPGPAPTDPLDTAEAKVRRTGGKPSKAEIQAEMVRSLCARKVAIAKIKARVRSGG